MNTVNVGIIGVGGIANGKHMPSLEKLPNVRMLAFCDLIEARALKGARDFGVPEAKVFTDYRKLLEMPEIDVVHVLTTNDGHAPISIAALEAGKHVMCEKPMAMNTDEARAMVEAARASGRKLTIGYQLRQRPEYQYLKEVCDRGELGRIYFTKAVTTRRRGVPTWGEFLSLEKQGGGPLIDNTTHVLDLLMWLTNNYQPASVMGNTFHELGKTPNAVNLWGSWDPNEFTVEDSACGFLKFQDGMTTMIETAWAINTLRIDEAAIILCGTKAGADMADELKINGERLGRLYEVSPNFEVGVVEQDLGYLEAKQWIDAIVHDRDPLVKPEEALVVTKILDAIYESSHTGKAVYFD
ncbi:MAG: Gfo/Idh/MocA family oxidoreductase [Firmicutes bacterium]|nr:Gfo/Idh/MocA family oxidoreductase [Bacillota bacterium]